MRSIKIIALLAFWSGAFFGVVLLFAFYFVGDGLRDAIDPKDR